MIATAGGDDMIRVFKESAESKPDEPNFDLILSLTAHNEDVNTVEWCPTNPALLISTSDDGDVKLWKFTEETE